MIRFAALALLACGAPASTPSNRATPSPAGAMPAEVDAFVERASTCQHWLGEEPYSPARKAEIFAGVSASCPGNDDTRARLEAKYRDRPDVLARLRAVE